MQIGPSEMKCAASHHRREARAVKTGLRGNVVGVLGLALLLSAAAPFPSSTVADAAMRGDRDAVRALLQQGADVNAAHGDGMTALHWASERGDAQLAEMLIYAGAGVRAVTRIGNYTPLHLAGKSGSAPVVALLIDAGADVNAVTTNSGATTLHFAAASGSAEAVAVLIEKGANINAQEMAYEQTPLVFAAALNRVDVIKVLLANGADPAIHTHLRDPSTLQGQNTASTTRQREILAAVREAGQEPTPSQVQAAIAAGRVARTTTTETGQAVEQQIANRDPDEPPVQAGTTTNPGGLTALLHAVRQGHVEAVRALLDGGANVNQVSLVDETSPILMATLNSQWDVALLLIERGADPNPASTITGSAPLWATVNAQHQPRTRFPQPQEQWYQKASYLDVLEALLKAGANPDARVTRHPWYLNYAGCGNGNCGLTNLAGTTAFFRAAHGADVEAMRMLVAYGADPAIPRTPVTAAGGRGGNPGGGAAAAGGGGAGGRAGRPPAEPGTERTAAAIAAAAVPTALALPLHAAAGLGFGQGVGAGNANRFMPDGWIPSVKYLIEELGFDVNARDDGGFTPLHFAAARGDNELIMYLVEMGADVMAVARPTNGFPEGITVVDMANGPAPRITPIPATIALLEGMGAKNNNLCQSC